MRLPVGLLSVPALALAAAACGRPSAAPTPEAGGAHQRLAFPPFEIDQEPALPVEGRRSAMHCLADGSWCAQLRRDGEEGRWRLEVHEGSPFNGAGIQPRRYVLAGSERLELAFWPHLVREAGGAVLIGVTATGRTGFSGGGASVDHLVLVRAEPGEAPLRAVLDVPFRGSGMIRACFGEGDMELRAEACHDEYELTGELALDPAAADGPPRFVLTTRARTYPGRAFRLTEQEAVARERRQWARSELVWVDDPQCSYRRTLAYDAGLGRYVTDRPLPDCGEYLDFGLEPWPGQPDPGR